MKNVLVISYAFPPLSIAGTFRPMRFVKYLPQFGWTPTIITVKGRSDIPRDQSLLKEIPKDINIFQTRTFGDSIFRLFNNKDIGGQKHSTKKKLRFIKYKKNAITFFNNLISIPDPLIYWIPSVIFRGIRLHLTKPYDTIITTSPPHSSHFAGFILSKILRKSWIADFRDPWVDNVYFSTYKGRVRRFIEKWLEKIVIINADIVIANTPVNREKLLHRYGSVVAESKIVTITNGFDKKYIESIDGKSFDKFTICHTGVFYSVLEPYFFFKAIANWLASHRNEKDLRDTVQVILVGHESETIKNIIDKLNLQDCVCFLPRVSHGEALSFAKAADLLLVNIGFKNEASGWIPLKMYDYLGCRRPVLGILPDNGAAANLVMSTNTGYVVSNSDNQQVSDILDKLYTEYKTGRNNASFCPDEMEVNRYEVYTLVEKLAQLLDDLVSKT